MNEDELARLRGRIAGDQGWTLCRCGHILEACADCMGWMREHSARIASGWRYFIDTLIPSRLYWSGRVGADAAEAYDRAFYGL